MRNKKIIGLILIIVTIIITILYIKPDEIGLIQPNQEFVVPLLGKINSETVFLPTLAIVLGIVDGFNPCAMWILIFLILLLLGLNDRKKMWILGLTFIVTSGLVYLLFMVSWLNLAIFLTNIQLFRLLISIFAIIFGMLNIYKFIKSRETQIGCEVTNEKQKNKIIEQLKKITTEKSFILAMFGIIILALIVNILELVCSLGLPVIFTQVLALNNLNPIQYGFYLGLYILLFLLDDIIIFTIAMRTLQIKGISSKYSKYARLIGGIIMLLIGLLMVLKPEWLMFNF